MKSIKKTLCLFLTILIMISTITPVMASNDIKVQIDGQQIAFDVQPQLINDRTMVPLRAIFEALGATVDWDDDTQTITSTKGDITINLTINNSTMYVNGTGVTLDSPACLVSGRTLVPVRAISEAFGTIVDWDDFTQIVSIFTVNGIDVDSVYNGLQGSWFSKEIDSFGRYVEKQIIINGTNYSEYAWAEAASDKAEPIAYPVQMHVGTIKVSEDGKSFELDFNSYYEWNGRKGEIRYTVDKSENAKTYIVSLNADTLIISPFPELDCKELYKKGSIPNLKEKCEITLESVLPYTLEDFYLLKNLSCSDVRTVTSVTGAECNYSKLYDKNEKTADYYVPGYNLYRYEFEEETNYIIDSPLLYNGNNGKEIFLKYVNYLKNEKGLKHISTNVLDNSIEYKFEVGSIGTISVSFFYIPKHPTSWIDVYLNLL